MYVVAVAMMAPTPRPVIILPPIRVARATAMYCTAAPTKVKTAATQDGHFRPYRSEIQPTTMAPPACIREDMPVHSEVQMEGR